MRLDRINERIGDRLDRLRLPDCAPALFEALHRFQAPMDAGRNHRLLNATTKQPDQAAGPFVNFISTEAGVDERLANSLKVEGAEISGSEGSEKLAKGPNREADIADFEKRQAA